MGTLDDGFLSQVVLGELPEPSGLDVVCLRLQSVHQL